jgi:hypothetical protein
MNKYWTKSVFVLLFLGLIMAACEDLNTELPVTDVTKYIDGDKIYFPIGTEAIDIYNTLVSLYPEQDKYYDVTGGIVEYNRPPINNLKVYIDGKEVDNSTGINENPDDLLKAIREERIIDRIKHKHITHGPDVNEHIVYLHCPKSTIKINEDGTTTPSSIPEAEVKLVFRWQRQTTNIWQNDKLGSASYTVSTGMLLNNKPYTLYITATLIDIILPVLAERAAEVTAGKARRQDHRARPKVVEGLFFNGVNG